MAQWASAGNIHVLEAHMETMITRDNVSHCHALFTSSVQQPSSSRSSHCTLCAGTKQALMGSALSLSADKV